MIGKRPLKEYHDRMKALKASQSCSKSRIEYNSLDDVSKLEVIIGAMKFGEQNNIQICSIIKEITVEELMIYFRLHEGFVVPEKRPYIMGLDSSIKDDNLNSAQINKLRSQFMKMNIKAMMRILQNFTEKWSEFDLMTSQWKKNQSPLLLAAYQKVFKNFFKRTMKKKKHTAIKFHAIVSPFPYRSFHEAPNPPPFSRYTFYCKLFNRIFEGFFSEKIKNFTKEFNALNPIVIDSIEETIQGLMKGHERRMLKYAARLSEDERRVFLGYHRRSIYKLFSYDIFEDAYPVDRYPVYMIPLKGRKQKEREERQERERHAQMVIPTHFDGLKVVRDSVSQLDHLGYDFSDDEVHL